MAANSPIREKGDDDYPEDDVRHPKWSDFDRFVANFSWPVVWILAALPSIGFFVGLAWMMKCHHPANKKKALIMLAVSGGLALVIGGILKLLEKP